VGLAVDGAAVHHGLAVVGLPVVPGAAVVGAGVLLAVRGSDNRAQADMRVAD
jgi:hypothetical protein